MRVRRVKQILKYRCGIGVVWARFAPMPLIVYPFVVFLIETRNRKRKKNKRKKKAWCRQFVLPQKKRTTTQWLRTPPPACQDNSLLWKVGVEADKPSQAVTRTHVSTFYRTKKKTRWPFFFRELFRLGCNLRIGRSLLSLWLRVQITHAEFQGPDMAKPLFRYNGNSRVRVIDMYKPEALSTQVRTTSDGGVVCNGFAHHIRPVSTTLQGPKPRGINPWS